MLVSTAISMMTSWLDDPNQGYFTPSNCITWLNMAQRRVQMELLQAGNNWYMRPVETTVVVGQSDYLFPLDFFMEHRIEIILSNYATQSENRQALVPITTNQQDLVSIASGTPTSYYIKKDRFSITPLPSQQLVLRLYYSPMCRDISLTTDTLDIPEQFCEYVALTAAFDGFIKDDRAAENLVAKRTEYREAIKQLAQMRLNDVPRRVVEVQDFDSGFSWT
jgi:hypothetical protein